MTHSKDFKGNISVSGKDYTFYDISKAAEKEGVNISQLPFSLRVLFENLVRNIDGQTVTTADIAAFKGWLNNKGKNPHEIAYRPARVLMQDFTGVPAVVDLAAMRDAVSKLGGNPESINPQVPVDLVIDHSIMVDSFGKVSSLSENVAIEMERNLERYKFLKWGQSALSNFRVVPPGTGICHQVNIENLAKVVWTKEVVNKDGKKEIIAYPDTVVGTDSHTTMVNGLAVLGWGVGGIEAEAAMLGQPVSMLIPEVIGFELIGSVTEGVTATDIVLTVTQMLRKKGVVGKFVEFYGAGLASLSLADRATIANMAPEYGATCGFFGVDDKTLDYLQLTGRSEEQIELVKQYSKKQNMWVDADAGQGIIYSDTLSLKLGDVQPSVAGPKRPQDRITLSDVAEEFEKLMTEEQKSQVSRDVFGNGSVVIAAITSCTNTSNPAVMLAAGLVAKKAAELGLQVKPWVKTSLAPGSQVVSEYLERSGLQQYLDKLGFNIVGYGCTTCIGNSGPLATEIDSEIREKKLCVSSVLSGNRNFEGRVHPLTQANYLMSPPLVVAYALLGNTSLDITKDIIGTAANGKEIYLKDIWPSNSEVNKVINDVLSREMFVEKYENVFLGQKDWQDIPVSGGQTYGWDNSTYINNPPYFEGMKPEKGVIKPINGASILALFGDSITTDHISPAGVIAKNSPAAKYLEKQGVASKDFNSYGSRRGNHEVMMRGTFANVRIKNLFLGGKEGGNTIYHPTGEEISIYDAAMRYKEEGTPLVVLAGQDYGMGSSRDWAAKGTVLLGVKAVIAESFERIHRSNLVGMGVLPVVFDGCKLADLNIKGNEKISFEGLSNDLKPKAKLKILVERADGRIDKYNALSRIDTVDEIDYFKNGGILHKVIRDLAS